MMLPREDIREAICPVCKEEVYAHRCAMGWTHGESLHWWNYDEWIIPRLSLWKRIKRHGLKARIF